MAGLEAPPAAGPRLLPGSSCGSCSGASGAAVPSPRGQPGLPGPARATGKPEEKAATVRGGGCRGGFAGAGTHLVERSPMTPKQTQLVPAGNGLL